MNWKKMMAVGLAAVSMMVFVTGCGGDAKKANTELPKKVVIGLDDSFPPMGFKDDKGEIVGFDIDMAKEAAFHQEQEAYDKDKPRYSAHI